MAAMRAGGVFRGALAAIIAGTVRAHAGLDASCAMSSTAPGPALNLRRQLVVVEERRLVVAVAVVVVVAVQLTLQAAAAPFLTTCSARRL